MTTERFEEKIMSPPPKGKERSANSKGKNPQNSSIYCMDDVRRCCGEPRLESQARRAFVFLERKKKGAVSGVPSLERPPP